MNEKEVKDRTARLNIFPLAAMCFLWMSPMVMFWMQASGPMKPKSLQAISGPETAPSLAGFLFWFGGSFLVCYLPAAYYRTRAFEANGHLYEALGVLLFRQVVPDGDLVNRQMRRVLPHYRFIYNRTTVKDFNKRTIEGEKGHLVLLLMGCFTTVYAWKIGWYSWAWYLMFANLLANLYPILLQRYTRARLARIMGRVATPSVP